MRKQPLHALGLFISIFLFGLAAQAQQTVPPSLKNLAIVVPVDAPPAVEVSGTPGLTEFRFYFRHLAALDAAADKADAEGTPGADTDGWRRYEQNAARLNDREAAILKDVAYRCNQVIRDRESAPEPRPGTLEILSAAVEELRTHLAPVAFESLARRIEDFIRPGIVEVPAAQASGAEEDELPVEPVEPQALAEVVQVLSLTWMLPDGFFVAECATARQGAITDQSYIAGVSSCFLHGTGLPPIPLGCGGPDGLCMATFPPAPPGHQRWTQAGHYLQMYYSDNCLSTGVPGLQDPLRYCGRNPLPSIVDIGDIPPLGGTPACWGGYPQTDLCPLAVSRAFPVTYLDIIPRQATVHAGGELQFATPNNMLATWSVNGPGTINDFGLYKAPASVDSQQTATITACDAFAPGYCVNATITLSPLKVEVEPAAIELLPLAEIDLKATIVPASGGQTIEWSVSPAIGTLIPAGTFASFTAPSNEQLDTTTEVTVKACLQPQPASGPLCGTAKVTVPKIQFYISGSKTELELNETVQLTAFVLNSSVRRDVLWSKPADGTLTEISPADPMVRIYKAPDHPVPVPIDIEACLLESPEFCATYRVTVPPPLRFTSITPDDGRWQAGTFEPFTITGRGFGSNPQVELSDLEVQLTQVSDTVIQGKVRILVATTTMAPIVTVTYSTGNTSSVVLSPIPVEPANVSVVPPTAQLQAGGTVNLTASCLTSTAAGCTSLEVPSWNASMGTISPTGLIATYTAPGTVASSTTANISACWHHGVESRCAPAQVTVMPSGPVVSVTPETASLQPGQTQQFTAQVTYHTNTAVTWSISPATGSISPTGVYTAPVTFGGQATVTVTATSQADTTRKDTATVTLVPAPLTLTSTPSPAWVNHGTTITWTATTSGGTPGTIQYALFRKKVGTTSWIPAQASPAWQTSNIMLWIPGAADVGTWDIQIWARDVNTPAGSAVIHNPGPVEVVAPLTAVCPVSPTFADSGTPITWIVPTSGGAPPIQFALFRRRAGITTWTPAVTSPAWQTSNVLSWTPAAGDVGTWEFYLWIKDARTPPTMNGYGYAIGCNLGSVQILAPLTLTSTPSPASVNHGTVITWTATASGGTGTGRQYALVRKKVGTSTWTSPVWQTGNVLTWTPNSADVATWDILLWVKDSNTPAGSYGSSYNPGSIQVLAPLTLTGTGSPAYATYGPAITWTATATGGTGVGRQYAFFRRRAGTTTWTPAVTSPAWQTSNVLSWTPTSADVGAWETFIWVKDSATPPTQNTYGYGAGYNPGPVQVVAPLGLTSPPSPAAAYYGQPITWAATATGGIPATTQYALFRKKVGTTTWIPAFTAPSWQPSSVLTWTPASADVGTWDIAIWVKDSNTPGNVNIYGYAASYNPGPVQVVAPLTLSGTSSPPSATYGNTLTWTTTASGGTGVSRQYAHFRRRAGTTTWTPAVTSPAWQTSNVLSWTPVAADVGTWETYIWVKDSATPPTMNTYGYAGGYNSGSVQIVAPLGLTSTPSPALVTSGNTIIVWTATASGGVPASTQFALFRKKVGTSTWIPAMNAPAWQTANLLSWGPGSADVGTWDITLWVRDGNTPPTMNTYGYAASHNPGSVQVVAPLTVTGTGSPGSAYHGNNISWTATGSGGTGAGRMYAFFRKKVGTTNWIPAVTAPAWQASNVMSWTPGSADIGTWETSIWFKDANTPANANTYGYGAYYNPGPVQVFAHPTVTGTGSPGSVNYGTTITWTASASGGTGSARQYAFFRKKVGTPTWIPAITSPAWQTSNVMSWTPGSADVGTWETSIWLKDAHTPTTMNGYGYAAYYTPGPVQVVGPLTLACGSVPGSATYGTPVTWSASAGGGNTPTLQYAFFRRRVGSGTAGWIPAVTSPAWQTGSSFTWTPSSGEVGTWETYVWVRDSNTPANMNTYGYAAGCNSGTVQVVAPLSLTGTGSPASARYGTTITWTANASGGYPPTTKYALFRRLSGTANWIPAVTSPAWQSSNILSWTPTSSDVGTWDIYIWVKDGNTPANMNTYGYAAGYNAGPVQVTSF